MFVQPVATEQTMSRTYRPSPKARCILAFGILSYGLMGVVVHTQWLHNQAPFRLGAGMLLAVVSTAFLVIAVLSAAQFLLYRISTEGDTLIFVGEIGKTVIARREISNWCIQRGGRGWPQLVIWPSDETKGTWKFNYLLAVDSAFEEWLRQSPQAPEGSGSSLDQLAAAEPAFGPTSDERLKRWHSLVGIWGTLHMVAVIISGWTAISRHPSDALLSADAALPVAAAALVAFGGRAWTFSVKPLKKEPALSLVAIPGIASVGLLAQIPAGSYEVDGRLEAYATIASGLVVALLFSIVDGRLRRSLVGLSFALPSAVAYAGALLVTVNVRVDQAPPQPYMAHVIDRVLVPTKKGGTSPIVTLAPWGPFDRPQSLDVRQAVYGEAAQGTLCVDLRTGKAGLRWFQLRACADQSLGSTPRSR